ncbi:MAG: hypothetical protein HQL73_02455 [Magnetococcales bacterium]|nr:hypothetical protein [Magnetococcales bacterium]
MSAIVTDSSNAPLSSLLQSLPKLGKSTKEVVTDAPDNQPFSVTMATKPISGFNLKSFQVDLSKEALDKYNSEKNNQFQGMESAPA